MEYVIVKTTFPPLLRRDPKTRVLKVSGQPHRYPQRLPEPFLVAHYLYSVRYNWEIKRSVMI